MCCSAYYTLPPDATICAAMVVLICNAFVFRSLQEPRPTNTHARSHVHAHIAHAPTPPTPLALSQVSHGIGGSTRTQHSRKTMLANAQCWHDLTRSPSCARRGCWDKAPSRPSAWTPTTTVTACSPRRCAPSAHHTHAHAHTHTPSTRKCTWPRVRLVLIDNTVGELACRCLYAVTVP